MIPKSSGIYKIENLVNGKVYIGSAANLYNRWHVHKHQLKNNKHHSLKLQRAWFKYGDDAFYFSVIELLEDVCLLINREQYWIDKYCCVANGYNVVPIAGSSLGRRFSEETIEKMSKLRKGRIHSIESRKKMSESRKGIKKSEEHKLKIGASNSGKVISAESRKKMSESAKLRKDRVRGADGRFICGLV